MDIIVKMRFGSHLYGTATENSDKDYKGIFMPSKEQIFLNRIPKSINTQTKKGDGKNSPDDVDTEIYSLHYFIHLACEGETVALDMLHAPDDMILKKSSAWDRIIKNRHQFYTKNLKAFVGYARRQASKYGIKGSRLNDAKRVLDFITNIRKWDEKPIDTNGLRLKKFWTLLPTGEHIYKHEPDVNGIRMYEVCGRKCCETATLDYLYDMVKKFYDAYGERARQAANNENIDWKAVSHALRAAFQVKQILAEGTITFPLKEADYLLSVKQGKLHYQNEVAPRLDTLMDEVEALAQKSTLPETVDRKWWDKWLLNEVTTLTAKAVSFSLQ